MYLIKVEGYRDQLYENLTQEQYNYVVEHIILNGEYLDDAFNELKDYFLNKLNKETSDFLIEETKKMIDAENEMVIVNLRKPNDPITDNLSRFSDILEEKVLPYGDFLLKEEGFDFIKKEGDTLVYQNYDAHVAVLTLEFLPNETGGYTFLYRESHYTNSDNATVPAPGEIDKNLLKGILAKLEDLEENK